MALYGLRKYEETIKYYDRAIEISPNFVDALDWKGNAFYSLGKYDEAIKCYDQAIEIDPNFGWALNDKGASLQKQGNYDEALKCLNRALEVDKTYSLAWTNKAECLLYMGNLIEAENCYNESINSALKNIEILSMEDKAGLAENLIKMRRYEEGREYLSQVLPKTKDITLQCCIKFLITSSVLLEEKSASRAKEFADFLEYYRNLGEDFKINKGFWDFESLALIISKSDSDLQTKFVLLILIDLLQGKIDVTSLSFFKVFWQNT